MLEAAGATEGKIVYMAVPNMADIRPFYLLDPVTLTVPFDQAAAAVVQQPSHHASEPTTCGPWT